MTDSPGRGPDTTTVPTSTHNPFAGLLEKAQHAGHQVSEAVQSGAHAASVKATEIYHDPRVQSGVNQAGAAAERMGRGAAAQARGEVHTTAAAARRGDLLTVAEHVVGGPQLIAGRIVATQVAGESMRHLSPEAQRKIAGSPIGHAAVSAAARGQISASPTGLARIAESEAQRSALTSGRESVLPGVSEGQRHQSYRPSDQPVAPSRTAAAEAPPARSGFTNVQQALSWIPRPAIPPMPEQTKR